MPLGEPHDAADEIPKQLHRDDVLPVDGEIVAHHRAASRSERQAFELVVLRQVCGHPVGRGFLAGRRVADRFLTDLPGGVQVAFEQAR